MIADYQTDQAIQGDGIVDGFVAGTAIAIPFSAIFENEIAAIQRAVRIDNELSTGENMEASIKSAVPNNCLTVGADSQHGAGVLEARFHGLYSELAAVG